MLTSDHMRGAPVGWLSNINKLYGFFCQHLEDHERHERGEFCKDTMICLEADDVRQFMERNTKLQKENIELKKQLSEIRSIFPEGETA